MRRERRLLQAAVALACCVPALAAAIGVARGAAWLQPLPATDLDSHFRYLSGILLAMALAFASCIPAIERKGGRMQLLAALVVTGGLARAWSLADAGTPSAGHMTGLAIELALVPALVAWQSRIARLANRRV